MHQKEIIIIICCGKSAKKNVIQVHTQSFRFYSLCEMSAIQRMYPKFNEENVFVYALQLKHFHCEFRR